jgi:inositol transporter-like SP family MFS transporter
VAGASGLTLWQNYLGLSELHLGWLNFISANCLGAAIGAIIGGFLADKYGRKFIYTYNLIDYMVGVLLVMCSVNFPMLLAGFLVTGISVGIGVPASWTYISESSEINNRGRNICISQMSWGFGPMFILLLGMLFAPGGYLYGWVESIGHAIGGVCPFGINDGVEVYLDDSMKRFEHVYPAAGSSNSAIEVTMEQLEEYSGSTNWIDVCKGWQE